MRSAETCCALLLLAALYRERPGLTDVRENSGIDFVTRSGDPDKRTILASLGGGVALFDYDADSDLDLYFTSHGTNALYRNEGGLRFTEVTAEAGVGGDDWSIGCAAADTDNDGLVDLYVTNIGPNRLYRNRGDGSFEDATDRMGVGDEGFGASAAFFDAEGDGDLDLYVANYVDPRQSFPQPGSGPSCLWLGLPVMCGPRGLEGQGDVFYRNDGTAFVEAGDEAGLADRERAYGLGVVSADYDSDGDLDLYVANDTNPNFLYRNEGGGRFVEVGLLSGAAYNGSGNPEAGMGVDFGDANGDGILDLFVTNFSHETNTLYIGSESGLFTDATEESGLSQPSLGKLGWGTRFVDLDNDGDEDLFVANGHVYPNVAESDRTTSYLQSNDVFLNDGSGTFSPLPQEGAPSKSHRGAGFGDLDEDGDTDAVVVAIDDPPSIFRNDLPRDRGFVGVVLVGRRSNRDSSGAVVRLLSGPRPQTKVAHSSGSILSSSDPRVLIGLPPGESAGAISIRWPSGATAGPFSIPAGRYVVVIEGLEGSASP